MNWFQRTAQNYEWQPIGAPFRRKIEDPERVRRNTPNQYELKPSLLDRPIEDEEIDPVLYPEEFHRHKAFNDHVQGKLAILRQSLTKHLADSVREHPERYFYGEQDVPIVVERFLRAFQTGQFHTSSESFRKMCRELGIRPTEKGIARFIFPENIK